MNAVIEKEIVVDKAAIRDRYARALKQSIQRHKDDEWLLSRIEEMQKQERQKKALINEIKEQVLRELGVPFRK